MMYRIGFKDFIDFRKHHGYVYEYGSYSCSIVNMKTGNCMKELIWKVLNFMEDSPDFRYETNYSPNCNYCRLNLWILDEYMISLPLKKK